MSRGYSIAALVVLALLIAAANLFWTAHEVGSLRSAVLTQCRFDADLGSAPITVSPATGKASRLGVTIVADSRVAWHGLGCPGKLAPPSASFRRWADFYHLPVD